MPTGKIKKVIADKGYGFINAEDGREHFFHITGLQGIDFKNLKEGDSVEFEVGKDKRGSKAVNVRASC